MARAEVTVHLADLPQIKSLVAEIMAERDALAARISRAWADIDRVLQRHTTIGTLCEADEHELRRALERLRCTCPVTEHPGYTIRNSADADPACPEHGQAAPDCGCLTNPATGEAYPVWAGDQYQGDIDHEPACPLAPVSASPAPTTSEQAPWREAANYLEAMRDASD